MAAATAYFMRRFDDAPEAAAGVRVWVTIGVPLFPPLAFYAALVGDAVELLDFTVEDDPEYWDE